MRIFRLIAPKWLNVKEKVLEGDLPWEFVLEKNAEGYNVYELPNTPSVYNRDSVLNGSIIDKFDWVFVDFDLKSKIYSSKEEFIDILHNMDLPPTKIIDSGNGLHAYWRVLDLDAMSYLRLAKRLRRYLNTDDAVGSIFQLMRSPGTMNTKVEDKLVECKVLEEYDFLEYTCEELDKCLPPITFDDEKAAKLHYDNTYNKNRPIDIDDNIPEKFRNLLDYSPEVQSLWSDPTDDRSKNDFRLALIMQAKGFTKKEAASVLVNAAKALQRSPANRISYAQNIIDKIWTSTDKKNNYPTVKDYLMQTTSKKGQRFRCNRLIDDTEYGFRLGHVLGVIGGSGIGKTTLTLNAFLWFAENNPEYHHFFVCLEQPPAEIAQRIKKICGDNEVLYDKIHIVSNYSDDGSFQHYSLGSIERYIKDFKEETGHAVGTVVVDHIGVLAKDGKEGESEGLIRVCRQMKPFAVNLNVMLIMLSQTTREKAGIGDIELDKDAAYGTVFFESFCDFCVTLWQPLKRAYYQGAPTVIAFKFVKIRHKQQGKDRIQEDICYQLFFDPRTERLRELTETEEKSAKHFLGIATNYRKADKKTDIVTYQSRKVDESETGSDRQNSN